MYKKILIATDGSDLALATRAGTSGAAGGGASAGTAEVAVVAL